MRTSTLVLLILNAVAWAGLAVMGYQGLQDIVQQHVDGYPNQGQAQYYLYTPLVVLIVSVLWPLSIWRLPTWARNTVPVVALLFLPIYLFPYTGGI